MALIKSLNLFKGFPFKANVKNSRKNFGVMLSLALEVRQPTLENKIGVS